MAYFQIPNNGIYLFQWNIQVTYTVAFTYFYSNIASNTTNTAVSPVVTGVNWGQQQLGTIGNQFMSTSGSFILAATANNYYNLLLYISGGGTLSAVSGYYYATRIG